MVKKHEKCTVENGSLVVDYRPYRQVCRIFTADITADIIIHITADITVAERKEHAKELLQWTIDDDRSRGKIKKMCLSVMQLQIQDEWIDKEVWEELKTLCQSSEWSNRWVIMKELQTVTSASSKNIQDYEVQLEKLNEESKQLTSSIMLSLMKRFFQPSW